MLLMMLTCITRNKGANKLNILFIGGLYEKGKENEYIDKSTKGIQLAINIHQWNIINGLDICNNHPVNILSGVFIEDYPAYKDWYKGRFLWSHIEGAMDENIGFINIFGLKQLWRKISMASKAKRWAKKLSNSPEKGAIVCYYTNIPFMNAALKAKKRNPQIKTVLVVSDVPDFLNLSAEKTFKQKIMHYFSYNQMYQLITRFDGFVLLTEQMKDLLHIDKKPYIVMEGIINPNEAISVKDIENKSFEKKSIVYSGSLHEKYGIQILLDAIVLISNKDYEFVIFGSGEKAENIKKLQTVDSRVKYMGYQNRDIVLQYQRKATVLVNPRSNVGEFNKYSFPSKNLEYLLSGALVIGAELPGIPKEYSKYINLLNDMTADKLSKKIVEMCELSPTEARQKALKARQFAIDKKNYMVQGERVLDLINKISNCNN